MQGLGRPVKIHPKLCSYFLVRFVFTWRCCWSREEIRLLQEYLLKLSVSWPAVLQEPLSERDVLWLHGAPPCKVPDFALVLVEFHQVSVSLFLRVPLSGSPALERLATSSQFGVAWKCDESVLGCFFQVSDEDIKEDRSQDGPLCYSNYCQPQVESDLFITTSWAWLAKNDRQNQK